MRNGDQPKHCASLAVALPVGAKGDARSVPVAQASPRSITDRPATMAISALKRKFAEQFLGHGSQDGHQYGNEHGHHDGQPNGAQHGNCDGQPSGTENSMGFSMGIGMDKTMGIKMERGNS